MLTRIYTIFDRRMREFGSLATAKSDEVFLRDMVDQVKSSSGSIISKHPGDFDVYVVGEYESESGEIGRLTPKPIGNVKEIMERDVVAPISPLLKEVV